MPLPLSAPQRARRSPGAAAAGGRVARASRDLVQAWPLHFNVGMADLSSNLHPVLHAYMLRSHDDLRDVAHRLREAMAANATEDVCALWNQLDHGLLSHMEAEERFVLPAFARVDRDEALSLLREHGRLRELLFELGIAVDLHSLRYARSEELIRVLAQHAVREERLLYRWAEQHLDASVVAAVERHVAA